ncbi:TlpA family protein disulfide reductase [Micromonospora chokoriensis]|uniref:Thiol-disulfide isomerase or thioredoxin n=1 Tax=Micromonospora chokoriensis TaxID=356851 RepID=A0A1C4VKD3_9ACTN|nr:TlpA disulfide reductase family protein [Micromonospora chokoriensis]SCE84408.1 Thiol-disulfide isomerase or thioredoxin [Micromonospora chokoriensis]
MNRRLALLVLPLLLAVAGCTADKAGDEPAPRPAAAERPSPFRDCATLTTSPTAAASGSGTASPGTPGSGTAAPAAGVRALPELTLSCFTGGAPVALRDVAGPAVINVWASWCGPCRKELPAFQRLSERAKGQLQVVGVNTRDSRSGAQSIGEDFGVRFPILVDQGDALQRKLERNAFPLTLFVDADGRIRHVDATGALDDAQLAKLVRQHLGLTVPA